MSTNNKVYSISQQTQCAKHCVQFATNSKRQFSQNPPVSRIQRKGAEVEIGLDSYVRKGGRSKKLECLFSKDFSLHLGNLSRNAYHVLMRSMLTHSVNEGEKIFDLASLSTRKWFI